MADGIWDVWCSDVASKLAVHSRREVGRGCLMWNGAIKRSKPTAQPYGLLRVRTAPVRIGVTARKAYRAHILSYVLANPGVRDVLLRYKNFDISHLCHRSLCIEASHLSAEPRQVNNSRRSCHIASVCGGHAGFSVINACSDGE